MTIFQTIPRDVRRIPKKMSKDTGMAPGGVPRDVILEQTPRGKSRDKWVSRGMKRDP